MTATINASTSAGVVTTADTSGILQLQTNGTAALTVNASQNVGIGTATPRAKFEVNGIGSFADGTAAAPTITFGNELTVGMFRANNATLGFSTGSTERARIPSTGGIQSVNSISVGNATPSASGAGITFPATQSASTDANTLDDYEEGTWTPSVGGTATYSARTGDYVKIGNTVTAWFDMTVAVIGTGATGVISGLPFVAGGGTQGMGGPATFWQSLATAFTFLTLRVDLSASVINTAGTSTSQTTISNTPNVFGNGARLLGSVIYRVA